MWRRGENSHNEMNSMQINWIANSMLSSIQVHTNIACSSLSLSVHRVANFKKQKWKNEKNDRIRNAKGKFCLQNQNLISISRSWFGKLTDRLYYVYSIRFQHIRFLTMLKYLMVANNKWRTQEKKFAIHVGVFSVYHSCVPFDHEARINGFIYEKIPIFNIHSKMNSSFHAIFALSIVCSFVRSLDWSISPPKLIIVCHKHTSARAQRTSRLKRWSGQSVAYSFPLPQTVNYHRFPFWTRIKY